MAEEKSEMTTASGGTATPAAPAAVPGRMLSAVAALLIGLSVGAAVGIVAGGTLLAAWRSGAVGQHEPESEGGAGHSAATAPAVVHTIDALVVNPADSDGLRFLMATMAVEVDGPATAAQLAQRDAEVREAVLRTLGSKTVSELADIGNRDTLKAELRAALLSVVERGDIRRIHLPQFVIQ